MEWNIAQLEKTSANDGVITAHWRVSKTLEEHTASSYGTCSFTPDVESEGFIPYADLTEEIVIGWVQAELDVETIEAGLDSNLEALITPVTTYGIPWVDESSPV